MSSHGCRFKEHHGGTRCKIFVNILLWRIRAEANIDQSTHDERVDERTNSAVKVIFTIILLLLKRIKAPIFEVNDIINTIKYRYLISELKQNY